jgi:hypothetical protein
LQRPQLGGGLGPRAVRFEATALRVRAELPLPLCRYRRRLLTAIETRRGKGCVARSDAAAPLRRCGRTALPAAVQVASTSNFQCRLGSWGGRWRKADGSRDCEASAAARAAVSARRGAPPPAGRAAGAGGTRQRARRARPAQSPWRLASGGSQHQLGRAVTERGWHMPCGSGATTAMTLSRQ